ncbi:fructose-specific PTS transporter subunit EIIC [Escherichia albertii]|uniref:fructose-specific PTS transporter subunit EIIC n=1 Tax=Escherichia albertii TaxID=208962 RepID=UPI0007431B35|nr:fructose-specific PTS transporter subunit EIIC [Escherichia albertii]
MKTLLIIDANLGQARAYMAKTLLGAAARKAKLEIIDNPNDAEMAIVLGDSIPNDSALNGKNVWLGDISRAVAHPELFLSEAKGHAKPYTAPVSVTAPVAASGPKRVVAVTACPTGVAHTFMAAEAIETEAKKRGWWVKVETRGSVGAGNAITPEEVAAADLVIVAADIEVDLAKFAGKPMYRTSTGLALKKTAQELDKAVAEATPYEPAGKAQTATTEGKKESAGAYRHLLTGVSYMLPMVVAGGLCIALSFAFGIEAFKEPGTLAAALMQIGGGSAFALMVPVLAGYIAFSIADRPGLTPGLIGGMMCTDMGGPVNKAAYAFGVGLLSTQTYGPMAAIMAAGMVPPLAMGLATMVARRKFDKAQQEGGKAALVLGLCFISEGAIPFAARDPMRVLPCCIVGGALTGAISMAIGAKLMAPHGGLFVLLIPGAITPVLGYLVAIIAGTLVAGLAYAFLKRPETQVVAKNA